MPDDKSTFFATTNSGAHRSSQQQRLALAGSFVELHERQT
jgi:hypothetical protein